MCFTSSGMASSIMKAACSSRATVAGATRLVRATDLGTILHSHDSLRLAFLNACEGAQSGTEDAFAGVAQRLVQQEIPAVIAMQAPISDAAAIVLAQEFYAALAGRISGRCRAG